jgi:hypothetical protein
MLLDIPCIEGSIAQDMDAETGEWFQWWELPPGTTLRYVPLSPSAEIPSLSKTERNTMLQDRIYRVETPDEQTTFFCLVNATDCGIILYVFDDEPSGSTEPEQAVATVLLEAEADADATRVMLRLWDDTTAKDGNALHILTLIEQEQEDA